MAIRVLHVIDHLKRGGAQISVKNLIENINDKDIEAFLCVLRTASVEVPIDIKLIGLKHRRWDPCTIWQVAKICKENNIDILHAHLQKAIISSLLASIIYKCVVVVHIRGGVFLKGMSFFLYRQLLRLLRKRASVFIANSNATVQKLVERIKISRDRINLVYNPVDFSVFERQPGCREKMRERWGIKDEDIVLGCVGRLHVVKGVDLLIEALGMLLRRDKNYFLVLAGDGPERERLEGLAKRLRIDDRVKFLGMCEDVAAVVSGFDIGVVPSRHEPFGRVAIEMMRMKVPIVTSGVDGLAELVRGGETGVVTQDSSPKEICRGIERLVRDEELRKRVVEEAYSFSQQFGIKEHVRRIKQIYLSHLREE
jgi:glycosyltransferase involved in cell wall biosynthesis